MDHHFIAESDRIAFLSGAGALSYRDFLQRVQALSALLGIEPRERVAIYGPNSINWAASLYAVWRRGGVAVPVDFACDKEELAFILNDCRPRVVMVDSAAPGRIGEWLEAEGKHVSLINYDKASPGGALPGSGVELDLAGTAAILYTSGTTAESKGVELSYRSLLFNIEAVRKSGMVDEDDRLLALFPFHHIVPLQGHILLPLKLGAKVCMIETLSAEALAEAFQRYKITLLNGVPQLYQRFHAALIKKISGALAGRIAWAAAGFIPWRKVRKKIFSKVHQHFGGRIKYFLSGGAALPKQIADDFSRLGFVMIEGYGMTEMGPLITFNSPQANRHGTVGKAVPGVEVRIMDGEVQARGPGLMNGYFNRSDLTSRVLADGWLKTGDLGFFDADGFLKLTGRRSDILVLPNGKNVNAVRIEELLAGSGLVLEAGLTVRNGRLFALIHPDLEAVRRQGIVNLNEALKWGLLDGYNRRCAPHERILDFGISPRPLPRTRLGKLKRHQLAGLAVSRNRGGEDGAGIEEIDPRIVEFLVSEGISGLHPGAHLAIDLGLDSLALIEFRKHLEKAYGLALSETVFIEHPSLAELQRFLAELELRGGGGHARPVLQKKTLFEGGFSGWTRPLLSLATLPFRIECRGFELLKESAKPLIIISNHQSFLDPILVLRVLPDKIRRNTFFMAKTRIFNSWFGRKLLRRINAVLLDLHQSSEHLLEQSREILRSGRHLMIFPEGTRSFDGKLGKFSRAFAMLARETGARIVPLMIRGAYDLMPRTRLIPRFGRVELTALPCLDAPYPEPEVLNEQVYALFRKHLGEEET